MAALAQSAQERFRERRVAEEVLPGGVWKVGCNERWLAPMPFLQQLEEDVRLLLFDVGISELIDRKDIHVGQRAQESAGGAIGQGGVHLIEQILSLDEQRTVAILDGFAGE
jgi:hypothetical protein